MIAVLLDTGTPMFALPSSIKFRTSSTGFAVARDKVLEMLGLGRDIRAADGSNPPWGLSLGMIHENGALGFSEKGSWRDPQIGL